MYGLCSWWVRRSSRKRTIMTVSLTLFRRLARRNLRNYPRCFQFWWPIIEARAGQCEVSAGDLLLNPVFRWVFLNRSEKLEAFESQLTSLEAALGVAQFRAFHEQLLQDISSHPIENDAHNRLLSAMTEVRAILRFSSEGQTITLIPRCKRQRTPDFRADKGAQSYLVEVKYVRPPDKLGEYLLRWWQAQKEVAQAIPQGLLPHLKFEWKPVESRGELSHNEIAILKDFFTTVLQHPEQARELKSGRLILRYLPNRRLPVATTPLPMKAASSEAARKGVFTKLERILECASTQLATSEGRQLRIVFLAINLSSDILFLWPERFEERFEALCQEFEHKGVQVVTEVVGYL